MKNGDTEEGTYREDVVRSSCYRCLELMLEESLLLMLCLMGTMTVMLMVMLAGCGDDDGRDCYSDSNVGFSSNGYSDWYSDSDVGFSSNGYSDWYSDSDVGFLSKAYSDLFPAFQCYEPVVVAILISLI